MQNNNERGVFIPTNDQHPNSNNCDSSNLENNNMEHPICQMDVSEGQKGQLEISGLGNDNIFVNPDSNKDFSKELNNTYNLKSNNIHEGQILGNFIQNKILLKWNKIISIKYLF